MHSRNPHRGRYDFALLSQASSDLKAFIKLSPSGDATIDFSDSEAVLSLNKALLAHHYNIQHWQIPPGYLCPPIPGRADYIHHLADLLSSEENIKILDIGTGATCIYPLLGVAAYNWSFVATDIDLDSLDTAQDMIDDNNFDAKIKLRQQFDENHILKGIIEETDSFSATMCNPPFYKSAEEAQGANKRKNRNLGNSAVRNFSGNNNELWYVGGETAFLHHYLYRKTNYNHDYLIVCQAKLLLLLLQVIVANFHFDN